MADGIIQVPADGAGKKIDTEELTVGPNTVHRERHQLAGVAATDIAPISPTEGLRTHLGPTDNAVLDAIAASVAASATAAKQDTEIASLSVIDDWDESDRAKVNPIAGQAGVQGGAGAVTALTQRVVLATDDPAVATLGATSGAKVVTDANGTLQQYLRGLVTFCANALGAGTAAAASRTVTATDDVMVGALTETAPTTDTASSGLNGRLQRIAQRLTSIISPGLTASATFTPAAASHVANDCHGAAQEIALAGISAKSVMITAATLEIDGATVEVTAWRLMLYNITPPSAIADDGAWTYADADRAAFLGIIEMGTAIDHGPNQWIEQQAVNKQVRLSGTSVFAYLVNLTTLTPQAVAHKVTLHAVQL